MSVYSAYGGRASAPLVQHGINGLVSLGQTGSMRIAQTPERLAHLPVHFGSRERFRFVSIRWR